MDIIFSILGVAFFGLVIVTAFTIGLSLLVWAAVAAALFSAYVTIRRHLQYRSFVKAAERDTTIIEGTYKDVTDQPKP